jgi:hypothetical protein
MMFEKYQFADSTQIQPVPTLHSESSLMGIILDTQTALYISPWC